MSSAGSRVAIEAPASYHWQGVAVVQRRGVQPPRAYLREDGAWPAGPWVPNTPRSVVVTAELVSNLAHAISAAGLTNTAAADRIGVSRQALQDILSGRRMPDLQTVIQAEDALGVALWPARR